jgi:hypothetical protein
MSKIAFVFSGLVSIPLIETMNPRNFLNDTPNAHLKGLSFIP